MVANEFARLWSKFTKEFKSQMEDRLAPTLTEGQLHVLELLLAQPDKSMKPSDFISHLDTTPAAVTMLLDRMEKNELIERKRDEKDRRIVHIHVTEKGKAECKRGVAVREQLISSYLNRISAHNQQLLVFLLGKVAN